MNETENQKPQRDYLLPASVLIAALLVSLSLVYNAGKKPVAPLANIGDTVNQGPIVVGEVTTKDHIIGSITAPVKIIEFSDLECSYCKRFHKTLQQVTADYNGKVAWVFRHFPLDQEPYVLHRKARKAAIASECANEIGGNEKFWSFITHYFEVTPSGDGIDLAQLPQIATDVGLDQGKFTTCLANNKYDSVISADVADGMKAGVRGTPYSIVISKSGKKYPINGALPLADVKLIIEKALNE